MSEYAPALAQEALAALSKRWDFTPKGPILIEIFPRHDDFAVRTVGLPGHDRRARRVLRPRGDDGFAEGAAARRVQLGRDAVARARARHHAADVESAHPAVAHRRHLGLRGEAGAARSGAARWRCRLRARSTAGEMLKLRDLNAGFQNPRTISLAYYEASLLVEHIVRRLRRTQAARAGAVVCRRHHDRGRGRKALCVEIDCDCMQTSFDAFLDERFGALRRALDAPDEFAVPTSRVEKLKALAAAHPESYRRADGARAGAAPDGSGGGDRGVRARGRAGADGDRAPRARTCRWSSWRSRRATRRKRARGARRADRAGSHRHRAPRGSSSALLDQPAKDGDRGCKVALQRVVAVDPFDAAAHSTLGRMALARGSGRRGDPRCSGWRLPPAPVDRASAHADLAEGLLLTGAARRGQARRRWRRSRSRRRYERAQDLLLKLVEGGT